jgi:hypothetical protein
MDQSKAGWQIKRRTACNELGQTYKHCIKNAVNHSSAEVGPLGGATDGRHALAQSSMRGKRRRPYAATRSNII